LWIFLAREATLSGNPVATVCGLAFQQLRRVTPL